MSRIKWKIYFEWHLFHLFFRNSKTTPPTFQLCWISCYWSLLLFLETCCKESCVLLNNIVCKLLIYSSTFYRDISSPLTQYCVTVGNPTTRIANSSVCPLSSVCHEKAVLLYLLVAWGPSVLYPPLSGWILVKNPILPFGRVGHTAWAPEGREGRSQAGPKGHKLEPKLLVL